MLTAVEGVFRNGRVELRETPKDIEEARVVVTFLEPTTNVAEVAEPVVAEGPGPAAASEPTTVQARSVPTAWEHLQKDDFPDEKESDLAGTNVPIAAPMTPAEAWQMAFDAWVAGHDRSVPLPQPESLRREALYEDRL